MSEISQLFLGLGVFISAIMSIVTFVSQKQQASITSQQAKAITELAVNTNSIKDALVRVTGEAEHAKGMLQGKSESPYRPAGAKPVDAASTGQKLVEAGEALVEAGQPLTPTKKA